MIRNRLSVWLVSGIVVSSAVFYVSAAEARGVPSSAAAPAQVESVTRGAPASNNSPALPSVTHPTPAAATPNAGENNMTSSAAQNITPANVNSNKANASGVSASVSPTSISQKAVMQSMISDLERTIQLLIAELSVAANNSGHGHVHQFRPRLDPKGNVLHGVRNEVESSNWSGYVVTRYETGQEYTSASGTWVVPSVDTSYAGYSSSWVGIGGFCMNAVCTQVDHTLIQLGTEQESDGSGNINYYAWYEMLPNPEIKIENFPVNPGDVITASLKETSGHGRHGTWLLSLEDKTTGSTWSRTFVYNSSLASAEWIEEAPYSGIILPLANYGTTNFDLGTVNGGENPALLNQEGVIMYNPNGQTSNPSAPDSNTDGFNACWGNYSILTACSSPNS